MAVAARRLGLPDVLATVGQRVRALRERTARQRAEQEAELQRVRQLAAMEQQRVNEVLLARKQRASGDKPASPFGTFGSFSAPTRTPGPPPITTTPEPPPIVHGTGKQAPQGPATPEERPLTAAEKLARKRRERR